MKKVFSKIFMLIFVITVLAGCAADEASKGDIVEPEPNPSPQEDAFFPAENDSERVVLETDAVWEGYDGMPFGEFLEKGFPVAYEGGSGYSVNNCKVTAEEGWKCEGYLEEEAAVANGNTPVTYLIDMSLNIDGEEQRAGIKFYMELTPDNMLLIAGGESYEDGADWGNVFTVEDVEQFLEGVKDVI